MLTIFRDFSDFAFATLWCSVLTEPASPLTVLTLLLCYAMHASLATSSSLFNYVFVLTAMSDRGGGGVG